MVQLTIRLVDYIKFTYTTTSFYGRRNISSNKSRTIVRHTWVIINRFQFLKGQKGNSKTTIEFIIKYIKNFVFLECWELADEWLGRWSVPKGGKQWNTCHKFKIGQKAKHLTTTAKVPHKWEFFHDEIGYNYRMPNINAALACAQLENLKLSHDFDFYLILYILKLNYFTILLSW